MANSGNGFPWHFDTNNFTVTLAIQNADSGGAFEYAPNIRADGDNFGEVPKVLDGNSAKVVELNLEPGDLQLFRGRHSLHRVAPLEGDTSGYVAIFSYVEESDIVATPERCKQLYGQALRFTSNVLAVEQITLLTKSETTFFSRVKAKINQK